MLGKKENEVQIILKAHKVKKLERFSFKLATPLGTTDKGIEALAAYISSKFQKITDLSLNFPIEIMPKGFFALIKMISKLRKLQTLKLHFYRTGYIYPKDFAKLGICIGQNLFHLKHLQIHIEQSDMQDLGFRKLAYYIQNRLPKLKFLKLWFGFGRMTSFGVQAIQNYMSKKLYNLDHLAFIFDGFRALTNVALQRLQQLVRSNLRYLKRLVLYFRSIEGQMADQFIKNFAFAIGKYLIHLNHLSLTFRECSLTNQGIHDMIIPLADNLSSLTELSLDFYGCNQLTNQAIRYMTTQIGDHLPKLQLISLGFSYLQKLTNTAVKDISANIINKIPTLKHVALDFYWCELLTRPEFEILINNCKKNLKSLKHFSLKIEGCNKITPQAKTAFKSILGLVPHVHIT